MCRGLVTYFSIKTEPSPKAEVASLIARFICDSKSSSFSTTRIPFPPPPADAFIRIGKPTAFAVFLASSTSIIA